MKKVDGAGDNYVEVFARLRTTPNCSAQAEWLNGKNVPTGPYCRSEKWDGKMVRRVVKNPILKGFPGRGFRHTVKHHGRGRRISVKNPKGAKFVEFERLRYIDPDEFDEVNALLDAKNAPCRRKLVNGKDPLLYIPRKRSRFPAPTSCCWYCGWPHVWGGNGVTENLMCAASRKWRCWNSIGFNHAQDRRGHHRVAIHAGEVRGSVGADGSRRGRPGAR